MMQKKKTQEDQESGCFMDFVLVIGPVASLLIGAEKATGEVLVLMNGAGEVNNGWLEPLLERIQVVNYLSCSLINHSITYTCN